MHTLVTHAFDALPTAFGVGAVVLLLLLLFLKEILRIAGGASMQRRVRALDVAIALLLLVYGSIIAGRFLYLLHGG